MKRPTSRIDELERKVSRLERELSRVNARNASPPVIRDGWWLGVLQADLVAQGKAKVKIIVWDNIAAKWKYLDPEQLIEVRDFWLNSGESIDADVRIKPVWYRNVWTWDQAYCATADNLPVTGYGE